MKLKEIIVKNCIFCGDKLSLVNLDNFQHYLEIKDNILNIFERYSLNKENPVQTIDFEEDIGRIAVLVDDFDIYFEFDLKCYNCNYWQELFLTIADKIYISSDREVIDFGTFQLVNSNHYYICCDKKYIKVNHLIDFNKSINELKREVLTILAFQ